MENTNMVNQKVLSEQYKDGTNLSGRISFHEKYSTNKQGHSNWIFEKYHLFDGCSILELGCGTGSFWEDKLWLLPPDSKLILSDFSAGMVDVVRHKFSNNNVVFQQIDIQQIPYGDEQFDIVIANSMLYHVPDILRAIQEVYRVLKKNGTFYAFTFGENGIMGYLNRTLMEFDARIIRPTNITFTLQNGASLLSTCFSKVSSMEYPDNREVTNTDDLIDYILGQSCMTGISINRLELFYFYEKKKDKNGVISIPAEYGMFIAHK